MISVSFSDSERQNKRGGKRRSGNKPDPKPLPLKTGLTCFWKGFDWLHLICFGPANVDLDRATAVCRGPGSVLKSTTGFCCGGIARWARRFCKSGGDVSQES